MKRKIVCYVLTAMMVISLVPSGTLALVQAEPAAGQTEENVGETEDSGNIPDVSEEETEEEITEDPSGEETEESSAPIQGILTESQEEEPESAAPEPAAQEKVQEADSRDGQEEAVDEITIFHTNDIHGAFAEAEGSSIGIAKAATLKEETEDALLVDTGDATQGLPLVSLSQGASAIELMNTAGYDLMEVGNHEFDYGLDQLFSNIKQAQFPVLAANVYRDGAPLLAGSTAVENNGENAVLTVGDKKIGFFGLLTADTRTSTDPEAVSQLEFRDEVETAREQIDQLESQTWTPSWRCATWEISRWWAAPAYSWRMP